MNVQPLNVTKAAAAEALLQYKSHRAVYDKRDWEIERIYRQIARGKKVISAFQAIRNAGVDQLGRPRLAIMRADQPFVRCCACSSMNVTFSNGGHSRARDWHFEIPWPGRERVCNEYNLAARLPRIPPQYRPAEFLSNYHLLWEANWEEIPVDPMLLKRIGKDAWIVLAAWDLTEVELSVLRSHTTV